MLELSRFLAAPPTFRAESAGQVFRSWNTCVKLAWDVPRGTHNYLVDNLLGGDLPPVKKKLMCQYVNFFQKLRKSPLREVRIMASLAGRDRQSVTGKNLAMLEGEFGLDPWSKSGNIFKSKFKGYIIPDADKWRLPLLQRLLIQRRDMVACDEVVEHITELIDSLCTT